MMHVTEHYIGMHVQSTRDACNRALYRDAHLATKGVIIGGRLIYLPDSGIFFSCRALKYTNIIRPTQLIKQGMSIFC